MGFFDDLVVADEEPEEQRPLVLELGPPTPESLVDRPPEDWFLPAVLPRRTQVGAGPQARVMLTGFSVWPDAVTLHLVAFLRRMKTGGFLDPECDRSGGLRVGLLLAGGIRVTTLDGDPWPCPPAGSGRRRYTLTSYGGSGAGFRTEVDLLLSALPPEGPLTLVIEWPDQDVPETRTELDAAEIRAAASEAVEIWPGLGTTVPDPDPEEDEVTSFGFASSGPADILASVPDERFTDAARRGRPRPEPEPDPRRHAPRSDWDDMPLGGWSDIALVRAGLDGGADPCSLGGNAAEEGQTPLHAAAEAGAPAEVLLELVRRGADPDAADEWGVTPLWQAVCENEAETVAALLEAGADGWRPCIDGWTPGRLALTLPSLAPLFENLPGAVPLTPEERAAQEEADRLIDLFREVETEGFSAAFVAGVDEEELIRRLGSSPDKCPVLDLDREPGPYGTGPGGFDPDDYEESGRWVGVTGVEDGCVVIQPICSLPATPEFLRRVSAGTTAYGLYFNAKGGTFGDLARDGRMVRHEELGLSPFEGDPPEFYRFRFWQTGEDAPYRAAELAYACAMAGMSLRDAEPLTGPPRRWVRVPFEP
ncbi:ankyrin repeat domain-containing protein [Streptomyces sp. CA-250714]|uniref:ankyrin repeat domain-containing protein n=1 Tax=Streptomyces sp. CA-250714 TaxID=3240060 RepID=UPI003D90C814